MSRLIVNAEDFGMTRGISRAIVEAAQQGIVTSATLMESASACAGAISYTESRPPRMSVGCHVILMDGTAVPQHRAPQLP